MRKKHTQTLKLVFIFATFALTPFWLSAQSDTVTKPVSRFFISTARPKSAIDTVFPFDIAMRSIKGDTISSSKVLPSKTQPTVLFFWMTTCMPCKAELEAILAHYTEWQTEHPFHMIAISTDFPDRIEAVRERAETQAWPWKTYYDLNREFNLVMPGGLNGLPQVFVLDAQGQVKYHSRKFLSGDEFKLFEAIRAL